MRSGIFYSYVLASILIMLNTVSVDGEVWRMEGKPNGKASLLKVVKERFQKDSPILLTDQYA